VKYMSRRSVLDQFGISLRTLGRWERYRGFPKPIQASGLVKIYNTQEIDDWLKVQNAQQ